MKFITLTREENDLKISIRKKDITIIFDAGTCRVVCIRHDKKHEHRYFVTETHDEILQMMQDKQV